MKRDDPRVAALPPQDIALDVLREKYAKGGEKTPEDVARRVARAVAAQEKDPQKWEVLFLDALLGGFIPAGRINSAAGTSLKSATLINCFVQPVGDSVGSPDGNLPGIYTALTEAAETMRRGGGVGYDFSHIRPAGARVAGTASRASGPVSYMRVFDRSCETVESAGARRGAQMGMLRCDHPDIEQFIRAKDGGDLTNFNISVSVTDAFMESVTADKDWDLVHKAEPDDELKAAGAKQRLSDGKWVYRTVRARELFELIMRSTYDHAEPGVIFIDRVNRDNNLSYCETIEATNPCAEQPLPPYGCCDLGSINLAALVREPFSDGAQFDFKRFEVLVRTAVRFLDNVLDTTTWPLAKQSEEAFCKRRIGIGFTGLGSALVMLGLRYNSKEARRFAGEVARFMRDAAYDQSVEIAKEKGPFPLFDAEQYLASPRFASRLPDGLKAKIRKHGLRNSHLLSIAPTGTISLAFADNASNGIEPPFSWQYGRKKRMADGSKADYTVSDHAYRLYLAMGGDKDNLPEQFVTALQISATDHMAMVAAVAPFIDTSISKTVNVPADYPYDDFKSLYMEAWESGLKGLATYRPNAVLGSVLSVSDKPSEATQVAPEDLVSDVDRRVRITEAPQPALASLRWPGRPVMPNGNMAWTYMVKHPRHSFAVFVGQTEEDGKASPFEVWVNGNEQPRGLGAVAKTLSMDMRSADTGWLKLKLDALAKSADEQGFEIASPPDGMPKFSPGLVAAFAQIVRYRAEVLGVFTSEGATPMLDAMISRKEPKAGTNGTLSWTVDVLNPATGDDFVLGVKELTMPDGQRRPYSIWLSGDYPKVLDGLCKLLSLDMRIVDPAWIGEKLRKLLDYQEPMGDFMAFAPGSEKQQNYPSTVAYLARLLMHRYTMLGILDEDGVPMRDMGAFSRPESSGPMQAEPAILAGKQCPECKSHTLIKKDGCEWCGSCGYTGACG